QEWRVGGVGGGNWHWVLAGWRTLRPNATTAWRPPIGRANATSSGRWSSGWKSRVTRSMSYFESTHIRVITIPKKKVCNFVGGESSPVLANLFLHYAFDAWMQREHPSIPFERYADGTPVQA